MFPKKTLLKNGRYRIDGQLDKGGFSVVYQAYDTQLRRRVAVKAFAPPNSDDQDARERFLNEARKLARLDSAYVVTIHDWGKRRGAPYDAKLADFGLVKDPAKPRTMLGARPGTPGWMVPEQEAGEDATALSDVYSFGLVAYWLLTGDPWDAAAPTDLSESLKSPLAALLMRCLDDNPDSRPSAKAALDEWTNIDNRARTRPADASGGTHASTRSVHAFRASSGCPRDPSV